MAREFELALPDELTAEQRRELVATFARELADRHGVAVDAAIHLPDREGDKRNHHAHVLTTTRRLGPGHQFVDPHNLVTGEKVAMTAWEIQDMAVQTVCGELEKAGVKVTSWQGNPEVDPSIWFMGSSGNPEWVVVRSALYPNSRGVRPRNWEEISLNCRRMRGHFASVALANAEQDFSDIRNALALWRGYPMHAAFNGLE